MINNNILICINIDLNLININTIWFIDLINNLNEFKTVLIDYNLSTTNFIKFITNPDKLFIVKTNNFIEYINENYKKFNEIIIKNNYIIKNAIWLNKATIYCDENHLTNIINLNNKFNKVIVPDKKNSNIFIDNGIYKNNIIIENNIYDYENNFYNKNNNQQIIYTYFLNDFICNKLIKLNYIINKIYDFNSDIIYNGIIIINKLDDNSIKFINKCNISNKIIFANYDLPNCINIDYEHDYLYLFDKLKYYNLNYDDNKIKNILHSANNGKSYDPIMILSVNNNKIDDIKLNINFFKLHNKNYKIILGINCKEQESFAKKLNIDYVYSDLNNYIYYSKLYNSNYIIDNKFNCFILNNYLLNIKSLLKYSYNIIRNKYWFSLDNNQAYSISYTNIEYTYDGLVSYNYNFLDRNLWNFKLNYDKLYIINDLNNTHFFLKENIHYYLKNNYLFNINIIDISKFKLLIKINTEYEMERLLNKNQDIKYLYITNIDEDNINQNYISRLQLNIVKLLKHNFDIWNLKNLKSINKNYDKILIDGSSLNPRTNLLTIEEINNFLDIILEIDSDNYLLIHDLHDWSYGFRNEPSNELLIPILEETPAKIEFKNFINKYKIKNLISITDGPEYRYLKNYVKDISNCYLLYHFVDTTIFNSQLKKIYKKNEILSYGWCDEKVYPFRRKIWGIAESKYKIKRINRITKFDKDICENGLVNHISESWISIACTSNYDYYIRKYTEISESGSVVIGNINKQIYQINGGYMIILTENMKPSEIISKIDYYLQNKDILVYLNIKAKKYFKKYNDNNYISDLYDIINNNYTQKFNDNIDINYNSFLKENIIINNNNILNNRNTIINAHLDKGDYILTFSLLLDTFDINEIAIYINNDVYFEYQVINNIFYVYIEITKKQDYKININFLKNYYIINNIELNKIFRPDYQGTITSFSAGSFSEYISKIINFENYSRYILYDMTHYNNFINKNKNKPFIILGLYHIYNWDTASNNNPQVFYKELIENVNKIIIYFIGTDIKHFLQIEYTKRQYIINYLKVKKVIMACESTTMHKYILNSLNLDCHVVPMPIKNKEIFNNGYNFPTDNLHIGIYMPNDRKKFFNNDIITEIIELYPKFKFYFFCNGGYKITSDCYKYNNVTYFENEIPMDTLYSKINCLIRITEHDGEPQTGVECMMLGKYFIFNHDMKFCKYIGNNKLYYIHNIIKILDEIQKNLVFNNESSNYYLNRNSDENFINNINNLINI